MHNYHEVLPTSDPRQILHDGCHECELRGADPMLALAALDETRFEKAWVRAAAWNRDQEVGVVSAAEVPLLRMLWGIQVHLERRGVPIGECPGRLGTWGR